MNKQPKLFKLAIGLIALISSHYGYALDLYAGVDGSYHQVHIAGESFYPASLRVRGGAWLWKGIGAEVDLSAGVTDDSNAGFTLDIPYIASVYARFQSPADSGLKAYLLLGYSSIELDGELTNSAFPGSERFSGGSAAIGLMNLLSFRPGASLNLEVGGHFVDSDIDITSLSLGLQYEF